MAQLRIRIFYANTRRVKAVEASIMKRKLVLLFGAALMAVSLSSCYTDPFYWGGTATVGTYRPYYGYSRAYSPYYRSYRYSPRSYGYPSRGYPRGYSYHHPHTYGGSPGHHHHHGHHR